MTGVMMITEEQQVLINTKTNQRVSAEFARRTIFISLFVSILLSGVMMLLTEIFNKVPVLLTDTCPTILWGTLVGLLALFAQCLLLWWLWDYYKNKKHALMIGNPKQLMQMSELYTQNFASLLLIMIMVLNAVSLLVYGLTSPSVFYTWVCHAHALCLHARPHPLSLRS